MPSAQRKKEMARAHARHTNYCTCGKVVHGNGAKHMHSVMHKNRGEWRIEGGHRYMTYSEYERGLKARAEVHGLPFRD